MADVYCPRLDLAVGPFAVGETRCEEEYDGLLNAHSDLLESLVGIHNENVRAHEQPRNIESADYVPEEFVSVTGLKTQNRNARCFLAIEIKNQVSRKHLMGGLVNASALGRVGVGVAWDAGKLRAFLNARRYLLFLKSKGKNTFNVSNLLIVSKEQLEAAISAS